MAFPSIRLWDGEKRCRKQKWPLASSEVLQVLEGRWCGSAECFCVIKQNCEHGAVAWHWNV